MNEKRKTIWEKVGDWMRNHRLRPFISTRNLSDPFGERLKNGDPDCLSDGKTAIEAGIRFDF